MPQHRVRLLELGGVLEWLAGAVLVAAEDLEHGERADGVACGMERVEADGQSEQRREENMELVVLCEFERVVNVVRRKSLYLRGPLHEGPRVGHREGLVRYVDVGGLELREVLGHCVHLR